MTDSVERAFSMLRRGPWNQDPNALAQERSFSDGQAESQGWLADDSVTADVIQANAVIAGKIDADAVTAREIAANTITAAEIAANTITAGQIAAGTITSTEIAANTITAADIAANTITAAQIAANTITATEIAANTITAAEIAADAITTNELAADAVITENLLAANVTSSRIELTVSGKNFGANSGSSGAPGVFFDSATDYGMFLSGAAVGIAGGGLAMQLSSLQNTAWAHVVPASDNVFNLGNSGNRWATVYRVGESAVSDEALKRDIADEPLGIQFVRRLRPRVFRWIDTPDTQASMATAVDKERLERECRPHEAAIASARAAQLAGTIADDAANESVERARMALAVIRESHLAPALAAIRKRRPGRRLHHGLIAQEVKQALDEEGVDSADAAFWQQEPDGQQALSYSELMIPLLRAVQETDARVTRIEAAIQTLLESMPAE